MVNKKKLISSLILNLKFFGFEKILTYKIDIYKLKEICFSSLLNNGRFILESSKNDRIPEGGITKHYGDTVVTFWTNSS